MLPENGDFSLALVFLKKEFNRESELRKYRVVKNLLVKKVHSETRSGLTQEREVALPNTVWGFYVYGWEFLPPPLFCDHNHLVLGSRTFD